MDMKTSTTTGRARAIVATLVLGIAGTASTHAQTIEQGLLQLEWGDPAPGPDDACCPGQACGECCTAATMLPLAACMGRAIRPQAHPQASFWVQSDPAPLAVAHRPPIRA